ncbi:nuclear transport factor 2 family protein [Diaphorobacter caeni]|uniref:nuclear transport factor 2 family protein n=1 Tax=Diaphorobacter caeni TaxID=2784387 RepID=UPI00188FEAA8|nr:DUF4440 domain-containing protein [Diaphorobacter caeni]MBF5005857.1 DUF4440 domain-containing protein [Diaphorobacter caeni]
MNAALTLQLSRLEAELHQPVIRANAARVMELLHSEFEEIGQSGQKYSRDAVVEALSNESLAGDMVADAYAVTELGPGVALLTYRAAHQHQNGTRSRHTLRSSIWLLVDGQWQLRYHQGTPTNEIW